MDDGTENTLERGQNARRFSVAATLTLRHGIFSQLLRERGWSQADLARYLGISWHTVHGWMRFQRRPPTDPDVLRKLMELTGCTDEQLFPPAIYLRPAKERPHTRETVVREVAPETLMRPRLRLPTVPSPEEAAIAQDGQRIIRKALEVLSPLEARIVRSRFGLDGAEVQTQAEIGQDCGVSGGRIQQLEARALRKLRDKPESRRLLRPMLRGEVIDKDWHYGKHSPTVTAPFLVPNLNEAPLASAPAKKRRKARPAPAPVTRPRYETTQAVYEGLRVVRVPHIWLAIDHTRLDTHMLCVSLRPYGGGSLPCTCGAVTLRW